jgi:TonB family protein
MASTSGMTRYAGCSELMAMSDRKSCVRCERSIDGYARICPYCNWDQSQAAPPPQQIGSAPVYVPPDDRRIQGRLLGAIAFAALLIVAFVVGTFIHGYEPSEVKAAQQKNMTATANLPPTTPAPRSNVTLVPMSDSENLQPIEQPITTAPAQAPGQQPNDATALPSDQYAAAAARAKAERDAAEKAKTALVDPRSVTGSAYREPEPEKSTAERPNRAEMTEAYLEYKPLPHISVERDTTARLNVTVGPDGRVTGVDVNEPIPDMAKVIGSVQNWRFKPATLNGNPVTAHVAVDITFRANE